MSFKLPFKEVFKSPEPSPLSPDRLAQVKHHFKPHNLIDICTRNIADFAGYGEVVQYNSEDFYIYKDNGGSVLGIAHLDTVQDISFCDVFTSPKTGGSVVFSPALDDRLGAWVITDLLPRLGLKIDWLLTTGEESGASTGADFARDHVAAKGKQYNWMFQFDRTGTDVVLYDYDSKKLREDLKSVGMVVGHGSFSDICSMDTMGCKAFNVGVGYENYHSKKGYAMLDDTFAQVARFVDFYHLFSEEFMPHAAPVWTAHTIKTPSGDYTWHSKSRPKTDWDEIDNATLPFERPLTKREKKAARRAAKFALRNPKVEELVSQDASLTAYLWDDIDVGKM